MYENTGGEVASGPKEERKPPSPASVIFRLPVEGAFTVVLGGRFTRARLR